MQGLERREVVLSAAQAGTPAITQSGTPAVTQTGTPAVTQAGTSAVTKAGTSAPIVQGSIDAIFTSITGENVGAGGVSHQQDLPCDIFPSMSIPLEDKVP